MGGPNFCPRKLWRECTHISLKALSPAPEHRMCEGLATEVEEPGEVTVTPTTGATAPSLSPKSSDGDDQ